MNAPGPVVSACWLFSKAFQSWELPVLASRAAAWGFGGLDLTVRPGGFVEPTRADQIASAVRTCESEGCGVGMLTTEIRRADEPDAEAVCAAAAEAKVRYLKLGYIRYRPGQLRADVDQMRRDGEALERLAAKHGVCLCHHVHSGPFLNANAALLAEVLDDCDPTNLGAYIDPCHLWIEGTRTGWRTGLELLAPHARLMAIKSFQHRPHDTRGTGSDGDTLPRYVPLKSGVVRWLTVLQTLAQLGYTGPASFHAEYSDIERVDQVERAVRDDLSHIRDAAAQLTHEPG